MKKIGVTSIMMALLAPVAAIADTKDWSATAATTSFGTDSNWVGGTAPANDLVTDIARFNQTSYANQPTATSRKVNGLLFGDGTTATAALTLTTGVNAGRLSLGGGGVLVHTNSGAASIGVAANQGVFVTTDQRWENRSSNPFYVRQAVNSNEVDASTPYTLTLASTGSGGITIYQALDGVSGTGSKLAIVIDNTDGFVHFTGAGTFSGGLTLKQGALLIGPDNTALGGSANQVTIQGGALGSTTTNAIRTLSNPFVFDSNFSFGVATSNNAQLVLNGPMTLTGNRTITVSGGGGFNLYGGIGDGGQGYGFTKVGTSLMRLGGVNTYSGDTKIDSGTVTLWSNLALQNSALEVAASGLLAIANNSTAPVFGGLKGSKNLDFGSFTAKADSLTLNPGTGSTCVYSGNLSHSTKPMVLVKTGAGTQVLVGANTYGGATVISAGVLQIGNGGTAGQLGSGNVTNNATLVVNRSDAHTITNLITGSGSLVQQGSGTLTLDAQNTYTGATAVSNGVLRLSQTTALSSSTDVHIASGAKVHLNFFGTQTIRRLYINGDLQTRNKAVSSTQLPAAFQEGAGFLLPTEGVAPKGTVVSFL